jgi:predicted metal-dependent hydrolase
MSQYSVELPTIGSVRITKKRGMRSIRLRITPSGEVAVSAPWFVPKTAVMAFLQDKEEWIIKHRSERQVDYYDGLQFGHDMTLRIHEHTARNRTRLDANELQIYLEGILSHTKAQKDLIKKAMYRALNREAEEILLPRLLYLSKQTGLEFNQAYVKHLTSRWGSCDNYKTIKLSFFLVQLPAECIDYVLIHELSHTKHMNHSAMFWSEVEKHMPTYKAARKALRTHNPGIIEKR